MAMIVTPPAPPTSSRRSRGTGKPRTEAAGGQRPHGVRNHGDDREHQPEEEDLARHMAAGPVDELRQDGGEENHRLRVRYPDGHALSERAPVRGALGWCREGRGKRLSLRVRLGPEVDEVGTADELKCRKSLHRPLGECTNSVCDGDDLDVLSERVASNGQYRGSPAVRHCPRDDEQHARPWDHDHDKGGGHEGEEPVYRKHEVILKGVGHRAPQRLGGRSWPTVDRSLAWLCLDTVR